MPSTIASVELVASKPSALVPCPSGATLRSSAIFGRGSARYLWDGGGWGGIGRDGFCNLIALGAIKSGPAKISEAAPA
jgi:hypothetical protein